MDRRSSRSISTDLALISSQTLRESVSEVEKAEQQAGRCKLARARVLHYFTAEVRRYKDALWSAVTVGKR